MTRPRGQWRRLRPISTVAAAGTGQVASTAGPLEFVRGLATRWQVPPAIEPLGHEVTPAAPAGLVAAAAAREGGYREPPELVWAAVTSAGAGRQVMTTSPVVRQRDPHVAHGEQTGSEAAGLRLVAPLSSGDPAAVVDPDRPGDETVADPGPASGATTPAGGRDRVPVTVPDAGSDPSGRWVPAAPIAVPPRATEGPPAPTAPAGVPAAAGAPPRPRPAGDPATAPAAAGPAPGALRTEPADVAAAAPIVARGPRALVGQLPVLSTPRESLRAIGSGQVVVGTGGSRPEPQGQRDGLPSTPDPGIDVPDWFSSGPVRAVPASDPVQPPLRPGPAAGHPPPPVVAATSVPRTPPRASGPPPRVPWPEPDLAPAAAADLAPRGAPAAAARAGEDSAGGPHRSPGAEVVHGPGPRPDRSRELPAPRGHGAGGREARGQSGPAALLVPGWDPPPADASAPRAEPARGHGPGPAHEPEPAHQVTAAQESAGSHWSAGSREPMSWDEPAPTAGLPRRRFRVGPPSARPAVVDGPTAAPGSLADLVSGAMAAAARQGAAAPTSRGEPRAAHQAGLRRPGPQPVRGRAPADLDLCTDPEPAGDAPTAVAASDLDLDGDGDDGGGALVSADEVYQDVRARLRHELLIDRERAGLLAD